MLGSDILEVAIGIIFVYLLLSLICSAVNEIIEAWLKKRSTDLERGIRELLQDPNGMVTQRLYNHPFISGLFNGTYAPAAIKNGRYKIKGALTKRAAADLPSYIPSRNFALALLDTIMPGTAEATSGASGATAPPSSPPAQPGVPVQLPPRPPAPGAPPTLQNLRNQILNNRDVPLTDEMRKGLLSLVDAAGDDVARVRENIENWFDSSMDRVAGWYKRRTQWILLGIGLFVTIFINVNTITVVNRLARDATLRRVVVAQAEGTARQGNAPAADLNQNMAAVEQLGLPIGWDKMEFHSPSAIGLDNVWEWVIFPLLGWVITAGAISLGAPFWFDLLNKFMVVRSTVKPREKSPEEKPVG